MLRRPALLGTALALAVTFSALAFHQLGWTGRAWALVPLLVILAVVVVVDLWTRIIPDELTLSGLVYALVLSASQGWSFLVQAIAGALAAGGVVLVLAVVTRGGIGGGDIKLMAMLGAALGWKVALIVLALSQMLPALVVLAVMLVRRRRVRGHLAVGALMAILGALALTAGR